MPTLKSGLDLQDVGLLTLSDCHKKIGYFAPYNLANITFF